MWITLGIVLVVLVSLCDAAGAESKTNSAVLKVSGYGVISNFRLKRMLMLLLEEKKKPEFYDATFIEDSALLLRSRLRAEGYLMPKITVKMILENGSDFTYVWDEDTEEPLPQAVRARRVHFFIEEGVFFHIDALRFSGLHSIPEKKARSYFVETGGLLWLKRNRVYSPEQLDQSITSVAEQLQRMGFQEATVSIGAFERNHRNGSVKAEIEVQEGPKFMVRSVRQEIAYPDSIEPSDVRTNWPDHPYSKLWEQDFAQKIRTNLFHRGYPDTAIHFEALGREASSNVVLLDMLARVDAGPRIRVGEVEFTGAKRTRESVMRSRVPVKEGEWLDRIDAEEGRYRLSRLGIFESVTLKYKEAGEETRDVLYDVKEGRRRELSLLAGYGSYELLRGGLQFDEYNVLGRAHHLRLRGIQSFKSTQADSLYTMPEFMGKDIDVFLDASGLRRKEISFTRLEYGGGAGVRKYFHDIGTDVSARYSYQILKAEDIDFDVGATNTLGATNSRVAALITDVHHDRRDNPLYPHHGYKLFANIELASQYLGGNSDYQRVDLSASCHFQLGNAQWISLGLSHGVLGTLGGSIADVPFNRRFFPGGENSIRGYQQGEAAPRDANGDVVGAETYLLGNLEIEQALTRKWSVVAFFDAVTFARDLSQYPGDESLFSVGGGIRWRTLVGPVRLEYGYNLNPRPKDPTGTVQFSLGFPF